MKKVLITGANGMVGSALVESFIDKYELILLSRSTHRIKEYESEARIIQKDLRSVLKWEDALKEVDCVIHLAAAVHWVPKNETDEKKFIETNVEGTRKLFEACKRQGVKKFLFFSTNDVYEASNEMIDEKTPVRPKTVYGASKLEAEKYLIEDSKTSNTSVVIYRPASIYGHNDKGSMKSLIKFCKKGLVPMIGKGENKKALLYLKDMVQAVECSIENKQEIGVEIFNISSGDFSYKEIIDSICKAYKLKPLRIYIPGWFCRNIASKLGPLKKLSVAAETKMVSNEKAKRLLGYEPKYRLIDGLEDAKSYYLSR